MEKLTVCPATTDDEKETIALWQMCGLAVDYNDLSADFCFACGKENSDVLLGINEQKRIVGTVMVGHDGHRGWIYYVAVDPCLSSSEYRPLHDGSSRTMAA